MTIRLKFVIVLSTIFLATNVFATGKDTFGHEFTFAFVEKDPDRAISQTLFPKIEKILKTHLKKDEISLGNWEVRVNHHGHEVTLFLDEGVLEMTGTPLSCKDLLQKDLFKFYNELFAVLSKELKEVKLGPPKEIGGGHIHVGIDYFERNATHFVNFVVNEINAASARTFFRKQPSLAATSLFHFDALQPHKEETKLGTQPKLLLKMSELVKAFHTSQTTPSPMSIEEFSCLTKHYVGMGKKINAEQPQAINLDNLCKITLNKVKWPIEMAREERAKHNRKAEEFLIRSMVEKYGLESTPNEEPEFVSKVTAQIERCKEKCTIEFRDYSPQTTYSQYFLQVMLLKRRMDSLKVKKQTSQISFDSYNGIKKGLEFFSKKTTVNSIIKDSKLNAKYSEETSAQVLEDFIQYLKVAGILNWKSFIAEYGIPARFESAYLQRIKKEKGEDCDSEAKMLGDPVNRLTKSISDSELTSTYLNPSWCE